MLVGRLLRLPEINLTVPVARKYMRLEVGKNIKSTKGWNQNTLELNKKLWLGVIWGALAEIEPPDHPRSQVQRSAETLL
jgi:hypothetical protein